MTVPELDAGTVYSRSDSGDGWEICEASPAHKNIAETVNAPIFSAEGGFYDDDFTLNLSADEGCSIYYTLDSSIPDEDSILYTSGIEITNVCDQPNVYRAVQNVVKDWYNYTPADTIVDKAEVVRAVAVDEYGNRSEVVTKTYFVSMDDYKDGYVLSLVSDPNDLFGEDGIYVTGKEYDDWYINGQVGDEPTANFKGHGSDYEIETSMEFFEGDKSLMSQIAGLRIQGNYARESALKRFSLYSREKYSGSHYFSYDFFGYDIHKLYLRREFEDAFVQSLVFGRGVGGLAAIPVTVFLDGEYWYDSYLREKYSDEYFKEYFDVTGKIDMEYSMPDEIYQYIEEHDLSEDEAYEGFNDMMDIQNYIDYLCCNIYLCNMDCAENHDLKAWKTENSSGTGYNDGRWRFLLYDLNMIGDEYENYGHESFRVNSFSEAKHVSSDLPFDQEKVFVALKSNENFCCQFVLSFLDLANTYFEKDTVDRQLEEWGQDSTWDTSFFDNRFDYIVPDLAEEFGLTGSLEQIVLASDEPEGGIITINTVTTDLSDGEWSGYYYTDYPVTISAEPDDGYEFVAWHHGDETYTESEQTVELNSGDNLWTAEFAKIE